MLSCHFTDLRLRFLSLFGGGKNALPSANLSHFYKYPIFRSLRSLVCRIVYLFPEKGHLRTEMDHLRREMDHLRTEMGNFFTEKRHLRTEKKYFFTEKRHLFEEKGHLRTEKGGICTEKSDYSAGMGNLFTEKGNNLEETKHLSLEVGKSLLNQLFYIAIHPQRVQYRCKPGYQVHKTTTSARLASPVLVNALSINLNF